MFCRLFYIFMDFCYNIYKMCFVATIGGRF